MRAIEFCLHYSELLQGSSRVISTSACIPSRELPYLLLTMKALSAGLAAVFAAALLSCSCILPLLGTVSAAGVVEELPRHDNCAATYQSLIEDVFYAEDRTCKEHVRAALVAVDSRDCPSINALTSAVWTCMSGYNSVSGQVDQVGVCASAGSPFTAGLKGTHIYNGMPTCGQPGNQCVLMSQGQTAAFVHYTAGKV